MQSVARFLLSVAVSATMGGASLNANADIYRYQYQGNDLLGKKLFYEEYTPDLNLGAFTIFAEFHGDMAAGKHFLHDAALWVVRLDGDYYTGIARGYEVGWIETDVNHQVIDWSLGYVAENTSYENRWSSDPFVDGVFYLSVGTYPGGAKQVYSFTQGLSYDEGKWSVSVVPEPAVYGLMLSGLMVLAAFRRYG